MTNYSFKNEKLMELIKGKVLRQAHVLRLLETNPAVLANWHSGKTSIPMDRFLLMCNEYNFDIREFISGIDDSDMKNLTSAASVAEVKSTTNKNEVASQSDVILTIDALEHFFNLYRDYHACAHVSISKLAEIIGIKTLCLWEFIAKNTSIFGIYNDFTKGLFLPEIKERFIMNIYGHESCVEPITHESLKKNGFIHDEESDDDIYDFDGSIVFLNPIHSNAPIRDRNITLFVDNGKQVILSEDTNERLEGKFNIITYPNTNTFCIANDTFNLIECTPKR